MRSLVAVEAQVAGNADFGLGDAVVGAQIDLLVFDCPPEPLDEHIVAPASLAIHADLNSAALKHADEGRTGELAALVGAPLQSLFDLMPNIQSMPTMRSQMKRTAKAIITNIEAMAAPSGSAFCST